MGGGLTPMLGADQIARKLAGGEGDAEYLADSHEARNLASGRDGQQPMPSSTRPLGNPGQP